MSKGKKYYSIWDDKLTIVEIGGIPHYVGNPKQIPNPILTGPPVDLDSNRVNLRIDSMTIKVE